MNLPLARCRQFLCALPGCPRRWFFPALLWLYGLFSVLFPLQYAASCKWGSSVARDWCFVVQDISMLPLPLLSSPAGKMAQQAEDGLADFTAVPLHEGVLAVTLGLATLFLLLLMLLLCWLRLRDAGLSPWCLLLGLIPAAGLKLLYLARYGMFFVASSLILYYLGLSGCTLALFILYCKAGQKAERYQPPACDGEPPGEHPGRVLCALFLGIQMLLWCYRRGEGVAWMEMPFSLLMFGGVPALLLMLQREQERAHERRYRSRALSSLYALFIPMQIILCMLPDSCAEGAELVGLGLALYLLNVLWLALSLPYLRYRLLRVAAPPAIR